MKLGQERGKPMSSGEVVERGHATMLDRVTANLPSRSLDATEQFYAKLGFEPAFKDDGWMILRRGRLEVEFFPCAKVNPRTLSPVVVFVWRTWMRCI
jgi:hypothetical protein